MISFYCFERFLYLSVHVEARLVHQVVQSAVAEQPFHFAEHSFNWVEVRAIRHVEHRLDVVVCIQGFDIFSLVDRRVIHEQRHRYSS